MTGGWAGGVVSERATCVLAPNPGPMTLDGTNTWVLAEPGSQECVVVDPGPLQEPHLAAVLDVVAGRGLRVATTLLTHGHSDHAESASRFAELTGAPVRALGRGHDDLGDGDRVLVGGLELAVVATPGHTGDSLSFVSPRTARCSPVTRCSDGARPWWPGPTGSSRRTSPRWSGWSGWPGRVRSRASCRGTARPCRTRPGCCAYYLQHRGERLEQVRVAAAEVGGDADAVVERVYADVPREVWPAARLSVLAQLDYLRSHP